MLVNCASGEEWTYTQVMILCIDPLLYFYLFLSINVESKFTCLSFYPQIEKYSNRVANYFHSLGYKKGDSVAFYMENRPEYIATWLGLAKIGVRPALINYNLKQQSLIHTIQVSSCKAIIYGIELEKGIQCFIMTQLSEVKY